MCTFLDEILGTRAMDDITPALYYASTSIDDSRGDVLCLAIRLGCTYIHVIHRSWLVIGSLGLA
jgi:hypothetical protein